MISKNTEFSKLLKNQDLIFFDGAFGTMLQKLADEKGLALGSFPDKFNVKHPEIIREIHEAYLEAGSMVLTTATFRVSGLRYGEETYSAEDIINSAVKNAFDAIDLYKKKSGRDSEKVFVALDIGPIGKTCVPMKEAYEIFKEQAEIGEKAGADLIIIETMFDLHEAEIALQACKKNSNLPVIVSMTLDKNLKTFTGDSLSQIAVSLEEKGADVIGINCGQGPVGFSEAIGELVGLTDIPIIAQPSAGLPDSGTGSYNVSREKFAEYLKELIPLGVKILGGCCGTTPDYIKKTIEVCLNLNQ